MNRNQWLALSAAVVVALAAGWLIGRGTQPDGAPAPTASGEPQPRRILYYRNPMGLADTSPVPKKDSMGMDYIPVYEGSEPEGAPGTVVISPEKVQKLGVRTEQVRLRALAPTIRASGTVQIDETRQYVIAPRFEGWVERLYANQTGMQVRRGQPLMSVYSPELVAAQAEYQVADRAARALAGTDAASAASMARLRDAARARLRNLDAGNGSAGGKQVITSPANAVVVEKPIVEGARFAPGETILRLADLSTVWVIANVPASSAGEVAVGQQATFESGTLPGRSFQGEVTFVQPILDAASRSVGVRVALPNPDGVLRPGLFGDVMLTAATTAPVLTIPRSAVIDSGTRQVALVQIAEGRFEPRSVVLGRRSGDNVEVLEGLTEGERVVVSANFLIDAESNLQSALEGLDAGSAKTPASSSESAPPTPAGSEPPEVPVDSEGHDAPPAQPDAPTADDAVDHSQHGAR